jgi:hypothetical protein
MKYRGFFAVLLSVLLFSCSIETEGSSLSTSSTLSLQESELLEWSEASYQVLESLVRSNGRLAVAFKNPRYDDDLWVLNVASDLLVLGGTSMPGNISVPARAVDANKTLNEAVSLGHLIFRDMPSAIDRGNSAQIRVNVRRIVEMADLLEMFGSQVSVIIAGL